MGGRSRKEGVGGALAHFLQSRNCLFCAAHSAPIRCDAASRTGVVAGVADIAALLICTATTGKPEEIETKI